MQEAAQKSPADNVKMTEQWKQLNPLQKNIYTFLSTNKCKKALCIAMAVKKQRAADVNPDLYKMKSLNLVDRDDSKHWFIKLHENADNNRRSGTQKRTETEVAAQQDPSGTETEKTSELTEQQAKICSFLRRINGPQKAKSIAKGIGRTTAKDVNPDLYSLKKLDLILHNEQDHLWAIKHPTCTATPSAAEYTTTDSANTTHPLTEEDHMQNSTPSAAEYTTTDGANTTHPLTEEDHMQNWSSQRDQHITINKNYSIQIISSQNFSIGDNTKLSISDKENLDPAHTTEYEDFVDYADAFHVPETTAPSQAQYEDPNSNQTNSSREYDSGIGDDTIWTDMSNSHITGQEVERQDLALANSIHTEDGSSSDSSFLDIESNLMHQNPPALTSSPIISTHSMRNVNISDICKGLADVTLDEQENQRTTSCSNTSVTDIVE
ncbi:Z-DNA-binding protein 1 [Pseudophryne corroboree]|uniref:Z-DNA-binding protein 1 n=1 Tax=Pseudophryne corroboree TaxID=495146 RepID=UPI0030816C05